MAKRLREAGDSSSEGSKKRAVSISTVDKWILEGDRAFNTATWLKYEKADRYHVAKLSCSVCQRFADKISSCRNFHRAFIDGSANLRTSSFRDHAKSDMHERAMQLLKKEQSSDVCEYAPIAKAFYKIDHQIERKVKRKFDLAYWMAKEGIAFSKMKSLCHLEQRHGVDLGDCYQNDRACATFVDFIAEDLRSQLHQVLGKAKFFSVQMDGSTDSANVEEELFLVAYFDPFSGDGTVHVRNRYLCVRQPESACASGLYDCLLKALSLVGLDEEPSKMIGFGCDGASVNIGEEGGVKALISADRPWVITVWCFAHRLELALKDALKSTFFSVVDEFLLRAYYIYSKSPKKCRELEVVVNELRECLDSSDFPDKGGNRPLRACGTRFITHKVAALERILDRFGAYINHLISLTEEPTTRPADKERLKGYIRKWREFRLLMGCAVFHDILKPVAILCKSLQSDELCTVDTIEAILRTSSSLTKLKTTEFENLPSVKTILTRLSTSDSTKTYQNVELLYYDQGLAFLKNKYGMYIDTILACLHKRLKPQDCTSTATLTHVVKLLATHGWEKTDDSSFGYESIEFLSAKFCTPLESAGVNCALIQPEWDDMVYYAKQYINLVQNPYGVVFWKLFNSPDAKKWTNILTLIELTFTIPLSNGHVERCFSQMKLLKTDRRASLSEDRLDHVLRIRIEGPELDKWDATTAVGLWWTSKTRRVNSTAHAAPRKRNTSSQEDEEDEEEFTWDLSDWENWLESSDDTTDD